MNEMERLIKTMEKNFKTSNIINSFIEDNLTRFKRGIASGKTPEEIEKQWSMGMMEKLGYHYVEAFDMGYPKGSWDSVSSHWTKFKSNLISKSS